MRFLLTVFLSGFLAASGFYSAGPHQVEPERIQAGIEKLLREGIPAHNVGARPGHPILSDAEAMTRLCSGISEAAEAVQVPAFLLVAIAFREGSFRGEEVGKLGEQTTFQLVPANILRLQKRDSRCSLDTPAGPAFCAALLLSDLYHAKCQSWDGAMAVYAAGGSCRPTSTHVRWIVRDRLGLARWLDKHTKTP